MLNFTVKNLIRTCLNDIGHISIYKIDEATHTSYDPEEDTKLIFSGDYMAEIDEETISAEVPDFSIGPGEYGLEISIYI